MDNELTILKGIHPGFFLANELRKRKISKGQLALRISEYPQVIGDITHGKRRLSPRIALKLDNAIGKEEGFFLLLQAWFDIYEEKRLQQQNDKPDTTKFRSGIFWDTDINNIDWSKQYRAVIQRIFERGNDEEKKEITRFYGSKKTQSVLAALKGKTDAPPKVNKRHATL
ncbi:plasmid maintenance system antidote protein [Flavobacterium dauae]|uniref:helix-turn-helix transcriptional regulator n=1 Tax=Flavobacterium dauae TaxID=1563479 RepID=UPI00101B37F6|nr:plasmid maintenance system antidote protein [Flavobacterium dauae]WLD24335.1 plasmid maintenance system antidote protein [Flavobacterium dauae]